MEKLIHLVWIGPEMPPLIKECVKRCEEVHRGIINIKIWRELPEEFFNDCPYAKNVTFICQTVDIFRIWVCHKYGGIYLDADIWIHKPVTDLFDKDIIFTFRNPNKVRVANGVVGSSKNNKHMKTLLDKMLSISKGKIERCSYGYKLITEYVHKNNIKALPKWMFYPIEPNRCQAFWKLSKDRKNFNLSNRNCVPYGVHIFKLAGKTGRNKVSKTDNKFTFIEIPKTGSTSVLKRIGPGYNRSRIRIKVNEFGCVGRTKRHLTAQELKESLSDYDKRFTLAFIRNPWDRMISEYFFRETRKKAFNGMSFKNFIYGVRDQKFNKRYKKLLDSHRHLIPQSNFVKDRDGNIIVSFLGKQENLQKDLNGFCDKLAINHVPLPHRNKTNHKHYSKYYTTELIEIVRGLYSEDIELGNYKFEAK